MLESLIEWLDLLGASANNLLGLAVLAGSSLVEFVLPPFPGDMITVFGGVLIGAYHWSFVLVFATVTLGSVLGGFLAFVMGRRWQKRRGSRGRKLTLLVERFEKHGELYLLLNRFLPGIRPLFFVAAGLAGMRTSRVLVLSSISAAVWNALLLTAGIAVGHNLEQVEHWLKTYSLVVWGLLFVVTVFYVVKALRGRAASRAKLDNKEEPPAEKA